MKKEGLEFEDRSDYIQDEALKNWNVENDFFKSIQSQLKGTGSKLLEGPRGTGKTHQMKMVYLDCLKPDKTKPFAIFVTLNKYFHLEPLLIKDTNAIKIFHSWVLSKIILGVIDFTEKINIDYNITLQEFSKNGNEITVGKLKEFESIVESPYAIDEKNYDLTINVNIQNVTSFIERVATDFKKSRTIILLDDAALTLTPEYFVEFLDIFRSLKTKCIAPKASVYPGTTEYSPRFQLPHDAQIIECWMGVDNERYDEFMTSLLDTRFSKQISDLNADILDVIKYASFGVPRTLIGLLRAYQESSSIEKTTQAKFNRAIEQRAYLIENEYNSLKKKMLQYGDIIEIGWTFFNKIVTLIKDENLILVNEKVIEIGILEEEDQKMPNRMIGFLKEVGLLFEVKAVKHGDQRTYRRFIPHILFLIENRTFSKGKGFKASETLTSLKSKHKKHPVRRTLNTLLGKELIEKLKLNMPPCPICLTKRLTDDQKFCHQCGNQLVKKSSFEQCMTMDIKELPLTDWQKDKIKSLNIISIGDFLSLTNPSGELRKARGIGKVRSEKISTQIQTQANEILNKALIDFLS
jgi:hypothetical protein